MFIDKARINVVAGNGGAGCMSFRREAHVPKGGPDGGDGGNGGDIIIQADINESSLINYQYKHHFKADRGMHGKGSKMHGASGENLILKVPVGTVIREYDIDSKNTGDIIADLTFDGASIIVAHGGIGGRGNTHFVTPTRRAPAFAELGVPGEDKWIELEMKLMADVALVGMPSVGKSSLISRISAAKPKIADYPFTTLVPNLGVVKTNDYNYVVADIPGLIEGAHVGKGLGHEFLRHIERSAIIVHIVDLTGGFSDNDPVENYQIIKNELNLYSNDFSNRPVFVVGNKIDMPNTREKAKQLAKFVYQDALSEVDGDTFRISESRINPNLFCISTITGEGIEKLKQAIGAKVLEVRSHLKENQDREIHYDQIWQHRQDEKNKEFRIIKEDKGVFRVTGRQIEQMVIQTDWDNDEAIAFLQHRFKRLKLNDALEDAGIKNGDEVRILDVKFDFEGQNQKEDIFGELNL